MSAGLGRRRLMADPVRQRERAEREARAADRLRQRRIEAAVEQLRASTVPSSVYTAPGKPGLFALWVNPDGWEDLGSGRCPGLDGACLWVGRPARFLATSVLSEHLPDGDTRRSGFRRMLAALLCDLFEWELAPVNVDRPDRYWLFTLAEPDEFGLSCWISAYVRVGEITWRPGSREEDEVPAVHAELVRRLRPALHTAERRRRGGRRFVRGEPEALAWRATGRAGGVWSQAPARRRLRRDRCH